MSTVRRHFSKSNWRTIKMLKRARGNYFRWKLKYPNTNAAKGRLDLKNRSNLSRQLISTSPRFQYCHIFEEKLPSFLVNCRPPNCDLTDCQRILIHADLQKGKGLAYASLLRLPKLTRKYGDYAQKYFTTRSVNYNATQFRQARSEKLAVQ